MATGDETRAIPNPHDRGQPTPPPGGGSGPVSGVAPGAGPFGGPVEPPSAAGHPFAPPSAGSGGGAGRGGGRAVLIVGIAAVVLALGALGVVVLGSSDDSNGASGTSTPTVDPASPTTATEAIPDTSTAPAEETPATPPTATQLAQRVVHIQLINNGQVVCTGSGTIIDAEGRVLTNEHVIAQSPICPHDTIAVGLTLDPSDVPDVAYEADLLVADVPLDLAVIRIARRFDGGPVPSFEPISLGDSAGVGLGDRLQIIGYPGIGGETVTVTEGLVSGFVDTAEGGQRSWIKTDAAIAGGNSGGLAANEAGEIVGVPTRAGTGNGQIVDCRILTDSNGDGERNADDPCVPAGGFINGVRPISSALPLIEAARTASPIPIVAPTSDEPLPAVAPLAGLPVFTFGVSDVGEPLSPFIVAPSGTTNFCLTWLYENVSPGSDFEIVWTVNGVSGPGDVSSGQTAPPEAGNFWGCYGNDAGLPDGLYEVAWRINGQTVFTEATWVGNDRTPVDVQIVNESNEPVCVVGIILSGTSTFGLNELTQQLDPGQTRIVTAETGPHDLRVVDCLGNVILEEIGTPIDGPISITVRST